MKRRAVEAGVGVLLGIAFVVLLSFLNDDDAEAQALPPEAVHEGAMANIFAYCDDLDSLRLIRALGPGDQQLYARIMMSGTNTCFDFRSIGAGAITTPLVRRLVDPEWIERYETQGYEVQYWEVRWGDKIKPHYTWVSVNLRGEDT